MATPYMTRRGSGWYLKIRIPSDIRPILGEHLVRSLRTSDKSTAQARALGMAASLDGIFMSIRRQALELITGVKNDKRPLSELRQFLQDHADELAKQPTSFTELFIRSLRRLGELKATKNRQDQFWLGSVYKRPFQVVGDVLQSWSLRRPVDAWRREGRGMGDHWRPAAA